MQDEMLLSYQNEINFFLFHTSQQLHRFKLCAAKIKATFNRVDRRHQDRALKC
jgi:hypothetical protein